MQESELIKVKEVSSEILGLKEEFQGKMQRIVESRNEVLVLAHDMGSRLIELRKLLPRGSYGEYIQVQLWLLLSECDACTKIATTTRRENLRIGDPAEIRVAMFQTHLLLPSKPEVEVTGDIKIAKCIHHMSFINSWAEWQSKVKKGKLTPSDEDDLRFDTRALYEWLRVLHRDNG